MLAVGKAIQTLRLRRGLTQESLARQAGISAAFLSLVERDKRAASIKVIGQLATALSTPVEMIIWDSVELPETLSADDRKLCELAKRLVRECLNHANGRGDDRSQPV